MPRAKKPAPLGKLKICRSTGRPSFSIDQQTFYIDNSFCRGEPDAEEHDAFSIRMLKKAFKRYTNVVKDRMEAQIWEAAAIRVMLRNEINQKDRMSLAKEFREIAEICKQRAEKR